MVGGNAYSEEMLSDDQAVKVSDAQAVKAAGAAAADEAAATHAGAAHTGASAQNATSEGAERVASSLFFGSLPPRELYVRWCYANALLPAVQFSIAPWQYDDAATKACRRVLQLREERMPQLELLARLAASTGEPIVRPHERPRPGDP